MLPAFAARSGSAPIHKKAGAKYDVHPPLSTSFASLALGLTLTLTSCGAGTGTAESDAVESSADTIDRSVSDKPAQPESPITGSSAGCVLDTETLRATTGLTWTANTSTASDYSCAYQSSASPLFGLTVISLPPGGDPANEVNQYITPGSANYTAGASHIARIPGGAEGVTGRVGATAFGVLGSRRHTVLLNQIGEPKGTSTEKLQKAFAEQLVRLSTLP